MPLIGHLMGHDQMGLSINALNILADMLAVLGTGRHGAGIWIDQRYLTIGSILQGLLHRQKPFDLPSDRVITARQMRCPVSTGLTGFWRSIRSASSM